MSARLLEERGEAVCALTQRFAVGAVEGGRWYAKVQPAETIQDLSIIQPVRSFVSLTELCPEA